MKKKKFFIFIIVALILSMSMTIFAATKTVYTCPDCGETSSKATDIYKVTQPRVGSGSYTATITCKHCGYETNDVNDFKEEVEDDGTPDEDDWIGQAIYFITHFFENLLKFIVNSILTLIILLLWGISSVLYGLLGNDFINSFVNYSLNFEAIGGGVGAIASNIKSLLTGLSFSLIVLFVLRNILLNYILWRGNPNENPLEVIIGIAMCTALIVGFDDIYNLIYGSLTPVINSINGGATVSFGEIPTIIVSGLVGDDFVRIAESNGNIINSIATFAEGDITKYFQVIVALLISIFLFFKFCQALISAMKSGFELLALRVASPMACLSLLNNNIGGFSSYLKELIKRFFGIMIKVAAINISLSLLTSIGNLSSLLLYTFGILACIGIIENPGQILSGFTAGGFGGNELSSATHSGASAISAGKIAIGKIASTFNKR